MKRSPETQQAINNEIKNLALYQFRACPFCIKTRRAMHKLNLPIELRDAQKNTTDRADLEKMGGAIKVPCLRIQENGQDTWMYESNDIIAYLQKRFA
jgi:glutaredoxin